MPQLTSSDEAAIATDLGGKIVFWNAAAERVYGWEWQEAVGRSIVDLVVPDSSHSDAAKIMTRTI